jgi:large subunit ribosomal protein L22e/Meckel syndrome type 1 protein
VTRTANLSNARQKPRPKQNRSSVATLAPHAPASAATRNYDCSKPGNANKAACKNAAKDASKAASKPTPATKAAPAKPGTTKVSSTATTKTVTERNYDCSKAGNKNKAVCKQAATPTKPVVKETSVATSTRHYDCTKPGNANKEQCKVSATTHETATKPVAVPRSTAAAPAKPTVASKPTSNATTPADDHNAAGATAQCKDGTYSHAKAHSGACSHHGGVAKWLA